MSEVVEPFSLIWENVDFIPEKSQGNRFLNFISFGSHSKEEIGGHVPLIGNKGVIRQGELVALMGPSGSGKSTLLKCLALGRNHSGFQGTITLKGLPDGVPLRGRIINQDDKEHLILTLTVRESLGYASQLKNLSASPEQHMEYVKGCLGYLGLDDFKDKLVENCSGGTTKRLALGLELIAVDKPHFLLLDEPISGLDSHVGETLIRLLGDCAHLHRMTIITTIHQPKESVFQSFNRVFILAGDGSIIYDREPSTLRNYLEECSRLVDIVLDPGESSIDLAIKIASTRSQHEDGDPICAAMIDKASTPSKLDLSYDDISHSSSSSSDKILDEGLCSVEASFTIRSFKVILDRTFLVARRQLKFIMIRFLLHAVMTGVLMTLYGREIGEDDGCIVPFGIGNFSSAPVTHPVPYEERLAGSNVKFQFFSLLFLMFASLMPTVLSFPSEIKLFLNEYRNGFYSTWTYYLAKTLVEIPLQLLFPYGYYLFIYWYFKQPGGILEEWSWLVQMRPRFGLFLFTTLTCCYIAQGLGFLIGILCVNSFNISIMVASSTILFLSLYSGFFVRRVEMGVIATGANFISFIRFGFENILISIFGKGMCTPTEESAIMTTYNLNDEDVSFNYMMMWLYLVGVRLAAFLFLKLKVSKPRFGVVSKKAGMIIKFGRRQFVYSELGERRTSVKGALSKLMKFLAWAGLGMVLSQLILASIVRIGMDML